MEKLDLEGLTKEELIKMIKTYSRLFLALDGFWFLECENELGYDKALKIDLDVWKKYFPYEARYIRKKLDLKKENIPGIIETLKYTAFAPCMSKVQINEASEERGDIGFYGCPSLLAMERSGRTDFTCNEAECIFEEYSKEFAPDLQCKMIGGPPRKSSEDVSCQWEFTKRKKDE